MELLVLLSKKLSLSDRSKLETENAHQKKLFSDRFLKKKNKLKNIQICCASNMHIVMLIF